MIDWSKPIRLKATKLPARAVADIIKRGKPCKVVIYETPTLEEEYVVTVKLDNSFVENSPEEIEKEVYVSLHENGYLLITDNENTARIHRTNFNVVAQRIERIKFIKGEFPGVAKKV